MNVSVCYAVLALRKEEKVKNREKPPEELAIGSFTDLQTNIKHHSTSKVPNIGEAESFFLKSQGGSTLTLKK